jgi:hypothetical protein
MTTRSRGPGAGIGWLKKGFSLSFRHPKPLLGGAALLLVMCLIPSLITAPMQWTFLQPGTQPNPDVYWLMMSIAMLVGMLLVPLYAGYLQVVDAAARGLPARARDIFGPYRNREALRLIGFGIAFMVIYLAAFGIVTAITGSDFANWYMHMATAQAHHQQPHLGLPSHFGALFALIMVVGLFMMGVYSIALGQVALRRRGILGAIGDGITGTLKNLLPMLVFALGSIVAAIVVGIAFMILALVLGLIGALISKTGTLVLILPVYLAAMLLMFSVMFGFVYALWHDVCGDDVADAVAVTA